MKELVWDPRIWVPVCVFHHGQLDHAGPGKILLERAELPASVEDFAVEFDLGWWLDRTYGRKER